MRWWPALLGLIVGYAMIRLGLASDGDAQHQWHMATRWTARASFPFLIVAYSASSLARLWPGDFTGALLRNRRWWGIGFAAAHSAHLCALINYFDAIDKPIPPVALIGGGAAYALMYAMALTSFPAAQRAMGVWWHRLHRLGIHYLWLVFAFAYVGKAAQGIEPAVTVPYAVIALGAAALRFTAWRRRKSR